MSGHKTAEESKAYNEEKMGEALGSVYSCLWQELAWLYSKWNEYVTLYGTKESRIDLLNKVAPQFFRIVQDSLWENILIHVSRMTDPAKSMGKPNASVQQLSELVDEEELAQELQKLISEAKNASKFCRDWRNRKIAHKDLDLALKKSANPLALGSRKQVTDILKILTDILCSLYALS